MANYVLTPNMSLAVPTVGVDPGPDYAINVNNDLSILDGHDHSPGYGVQITPAGLNINADLPIADNNLTNVRTIRFIPQGSTPSGTLDIGCLYEFGVDLYYIDGSGNVIRITNSGGVAGTPGSIGNLTAPASATYVAGSSTFVWQSAAGVAANMDFGSALLRNLSPNSTFALTLSPPAALAQNYTLTLPALPASSNTFLTIAPSGIINSVVTVDNSTLVISGNSLKVNNQGITSTQIATSTITGSNIAASTITGGNIASNTVTSSNIVKFPENTSTVNTGGSNGPTPFLIASTTVTMTGGKNALMIVLGNSASNIVLAGGTGVLSLEMDGTTYSQYLMSPGTYYQNVIGFVPGASISAGSHTFSIYGTSTTGQNLTWAAVSILAFELA